MQASIQIIFWKVLSRLTEVILKSLYFRFILLCSVMWHERAQTQFLHPLCCRMLNK